MRLARYTSIGVGLAVSRRHGSLLAILACGLTMVFSATADAAPTHVSRLSRPVVERRSTIVCEEDSCQPLPSPPEDLSPGTLVPSEGNPPVHFHREPEKPHHVHRHPKKGNGNHGKGEKHR